MPRPEIQKVRAQLADLRERNEAAAHTNAILEASLVLAVDETKSLLTRLGQLERRCEQRDREHAEIKTSLTVLLDYLDRIDPSPGGRA